MAAAGEADLGRFITLEGGEGAGKSTHLTFLTRRLQSVGLDAVGTREPGGAPGAEEIRELLVHGHVERWSPMTEALLHYAARREHLGKTVMPALQAGRWVVCDRFADSTMAYQGYGHGLGVDKVARLHELVVGAFAPDLTLIFDVPVDVGLARAGARGGEGEAAEDRYERMDPAFHRRIRDGFLEIAARAPERCVVIDAGGELDAVQDAIREAVRQRLGVALP